MAKKDKQDKEEDSVNLSDAETRKMLHSDAAITGTALKTGVMTGLLTGVIGSIESFFMIPDFVRKFKQHAPEEKFLPRLTGTMRGNKLLTGLVAAPALITAVAGVWSYVSAKSKLKQKQHELQAIEQKEAAAQPVHAAAPEHTGQTNWVERTGIGKNTGEALQR